MMDLIYRSVQLEQSDDPPGFNGYAATWWDVDSYTTALKPGAFKKTLKERVARIPLLWQHQPDAPIGLHRELREDKRGLWFDAEIVEDTRIGAEAMALLRAGVPLGMSFGFQTIRDRSAEDEDPLNLSQAPDVKAKDVRIITEAKIWETSIVSFPANEQAAIQSVRAEALTPEQCDLLMTLLERWRSAEPMPDPASTSLTESRNRKRETDIALALARSRGWIGVMQE